MSPEEKAELIKILRKKIQDVKHLKYIQTDDSYLQRFLYSTNFDIDEAFARMLLYHETMVEQPEFYPKYSPLEKKNLFHANCCVMWPGCDKEGRPIYIQKTANMDPSSMNLLDLIAIDDIWMEYGLISRPEDAAKGVCIIIDVKDYNWKLIKWFQPGVLNKGNKRLDSLPVKDYRVHIVNTSTMVNLALKAVWPFILEQRKKMIFPHFDNFNSLYKHIDRSVLPKEYGGGREIDYKELYQPIFDNSEQIAKNFQLYRSVQKC